MIEVFVNSTFFSFLQTQTQKICSVGKYSSDQSIPLNAAMEMFKVRCEDASTIFGILMESSGDAANALARILPCLATSPDIRAITNKYGRSPMVQKRLEQILGSAHRAMIGPRDGFYRLDLRMASDRLCLKVLMEKSATNAKWRKVNNMADISQCGNWSCFRNKYFVPSYPEQQPLEFTNSCLTPMPTSGIIEFDFVDSTRNGTLNRETVTDTWFVNKLVEASVISPQRRDIALNWLTNISVLQRKNSTGTGYSLWAPDTGRAVHISAYLYEKIYHPQQLANRHKQMVHTAQKERAVQAALLAAEKKAADDLAAKQAALIKATRGGKKGMLSRSPTKQQFKSRPNSAAHSSGGLIPSQLADVVQKQLMGGSDFAGVNSTAGIGGVLEGADSPLDSDYASDEDDDDFVTDDFEPRDGSVPPPPSESNSVLDSPVQALRRNSSMGSIVRRTMKKEDKFATAKNLRLIKSVLELLNNGKLIRARHLALLMLFFGEGATMRNDYGSYRLELFFSLFEKLKDLQNVDMVLAHLTPSEHACVVGRIGYLALFNPIRPEGTYELDLSKWEERQVILRATNTNSFIKFVIASLALSLDRQDAHSVRGL